MRPSSRRERSDKRAVSSPSRPLTNDCPMTSPRGRCRRAGHASREPAAWRWRRTAPRSRDDPGTWKMSTTDGCRPSASAADAGASRSRAAAAVAAAGSADDDEGRLDVLEARRLDVEAASDHQRPFHWSPPAWQTVDTRNNFRSELYVLSVS